MTNKEYELLNKAYNELNGILSGLLIHRNAKQAYEDLLSPLIKISTLIKEFSAKKREKEAAKWAK